MKLYEVKLELTTVYVVANSISQAMSAAKKKYSSMGEVEGASQIADSVIIVASAKTVKKK